MQEIRNSSHPVVIGIYDPQSQIKCHDKSENKLSKEEKVAKHTRF